ncbi:MAG: hypothetical protein QQN44_07245, partial [Nitrosopumilus sp.]
MSSAANLSFFDKASLNIFCFFSNTCKTKEVVETTQPIPVIDDQEQEDQEQKDNQEQQEKTEETTPTTEQGIIYIDRTQTIEKYITIRETPIIQNTYPTEIIEKTIIEEYDASSLERMIASNRSIINMLAGTDDADDLTDNSITDLSDVSTTGVVNGQILYWNGSNWIPTTTTALETDPNVDTEAEIEAITGAFFGTSKAVTAG